MQEEKLEVVSANESFYRAFESRDIKEMERFGRRITKFNAGIRGGGS